ncbi:MAG: recombinase family protein [Gaiellaceae bacterium]
MQTEWGARLIPIAELERYLTERRQARTRRARAVRPGRRPGLAPDLIVRIRAEHAEGASLGEIARRLNTDCIPTSQGGRQWWPSSVRALLIRSEAVSRSRD